MSDDSTPGIPSPDGAADVIDTDYVVGQDNHEGSVGPFGFDIHNPVFQISGLSIVAFVFYTLALPEQAGATFATWQVVLEHRREERENDRKPDQIQK